MPTRFANIDLDDALTLIASHVEEWQSENFAFYDGDHWQDTDGWVGPRPKQTAEGYEIVMSEIERGFVSANVIRELVLRHANGVLGHEPGWSFRLKRKLGKVPVTDPQTGEPVLNIDGTPKMEDDKPTAEEQAILDEANNALVAWWDKREVLTELQRAVVSALLTKRGPLRLFVPAGLRDTAGQIPRQTDLEGAFEYIYLQAPAYDEATVALDDLTMQRCGAFSFQTVTALENELGEPIAQTANTNSNSRVEICYVDGEDTVIRILKQANIENTDPNAGIEAEFRYRLGKRLLMTEIDRPELISEQIRQSQKLVNMALTMAQRNVVLGGFLATILLNAQIPGEWVDDPASPEGRRFVPNPLKLGAGTVTYISGVPRQNPDGSVTTTTPAVQFRDPVSVTTFRDTKSMAEETMLREAHQLHALLSGDATASGESRRQAMADFVTDLITTASRVNPVGRWVCETALALAALFMGEPGKYDILEASFDTRVDPGPVPADEQTLAIALYNAKLMPREIAMLRVGAEDPDAWVEMLREEREESMAYGFFQQRNNPQPPQQGDQQQQQQPPADNSNANTEGY